MSLSLLERQRGDLWLLIDGWELSLRAANKSPRTIRSYIDTARDSFGQYLLANRFPTDVANIEREHVEQYQIDQLARFSANTAALRHRTLKVFFSWLIDEQEIPVSPMVHVKPPRPGEIEVPTIGAEDLRLLLAACGRADFDGRRDAAMILTFYDTGLRLSEMAGLGVNGVDTAARILHVTGKGNRGRPVRYGNNTAAAMNRYQRERVKHPRATAPGWWLGPRGQMTPSGIAQMLRRRCRQAELDPIHPHQFRHSFAAAWMASGGSEGDLMQLAGWSSRDMLARYGRYTASERALDAHELYSPGDRL